MGYDLKQETKNVQSPLTKQLFQQIQEDFFREIGKTNYDSSVKNNIIKIYRKTAEKTTDNFIVKLISDAVIKVDRRKTRGRRKTDGL